ncbi:MAG: CBS domain-containing protein [Labilithrix sp.]|nr:CBS domain-containing protein [Labilithrix sp.]
MMKATECTVANATVRDRMTSPAITVRRDARREDVERLLETRRISAVAVVDEDGRVAGVVSTTDLLRAPEVDRVEAMMAAPALIARPDERLDEAAWRLVAARVHRLVVVDGDRPIGVLSARDILGEVMYRRIPTPIRAIMSTPVQTVAIGDSVDEAALRLTSANVHGLVVVDGTAPVGVFTQAEALAARKLTVPRSVVVEEVMSYETICLDAATSVHRAAAYAMAMNVRRFLVCEDKHLVGVLSCVDLVGVLARGAPQ